MIITDIKQATLKKFKESRVFLFYEQNKIYTLFMKKYKLNVKLALHTMKHVNKMIEPIHLCTII